MLFKPAWLTISHTTKSTKVHVFDNQINRTIKCNSIILLLYIRYFVEYEYEALGING